MQYRTGWEVMHGVTMQNTVAITDKFIAVIFITAGEFGRAGAQGE